MLWRSSYFIIYSFTKANSADITGLNVVFKLNGYSCIAILPKTRARAKPENKPCLLVRGAPPRITALDRSQLISMLPMLGRSRPRIRPPNRPSGGLNKRYYPSHSGQQHEVRGRKDQKLEVHLHPSENIDISRWILSPPGAWQKQS